MNLIQVYVIVLPIPSGDEIDFFQFERVKDGLICNNLHPGLYQMPGDIAQDVFTRFDNGWFYPYRIKAAGYNNTSDVFTVELEEV
jgi:hypothetical protein